MISERDDLNRFRDAYLDYLEGARDEPPALEQLPEDQRPAAESFVESIFAARGVDPYASRPSIEQLLAWRSQTNDQAGDLGEVLQDYLRLRIDPRAMVASDPASAAMGLAVGPGYPGQGNASPCRTGNDLREPRLRPHQEGR